MTSPKIPISSASVVLRSVTAADLDTLFEYQRDPDLIAMAALPPRSREAFLAHWTNNILSNGAVYARAIATDDALAGYIVSFEKRGERCIGYALGKPYWGHGIASRALPQFLAIERARPLFGRVAKHNVASARVLVKSGFMKFGEEIDPEGDGVDEFIFRLDE